MKNGFTLIELMVVIAIIVIIAAIAIPNLLSSRIRANEATAISAVKAYATAQLTFQTARHGNAGGTATNGANVADGYTATYPSLAYGIVPVAGGARLGLISDVFASAAVSSAVVPPAGAPAMGTPYQGYQFQEPADAAGGPAYFNLQYALVGVPANTDATGNNAYWCGVQGTVYMTAMTPGSVTGAASFATLPATPSAVPGVIPAVWSVL